MERAHLKVFMNGNIDEFREVVFYRHMSKKDLLSNAMEEFHVSHMKR
jgi:hypothetical protein